MYLLCFNCFCHLVFCCLVSHLFKMLYSVIFLGVAVIQLVLNRADVVIECDVEFFSCVFLRLYLHIKLVSTWHCQPVRLLLDWSMKIVVFCETNVVYHGIDLSPTVVLCKMHIRYHPMIEDVIWRTSWRKCSPLEWHFMYTL